MKIPVRWRLEWGRKARRKILRESYETFFRENGGDFVKVDMDAKQCLRLGIDAEYCADPFLFRWHGNDYLFYESMDCDGKGVLGCLERCASGWRQLGIVLDEPWHLSYPQVFEDNDHIYMIPESCDLTNDFERGAVRLYEAEEFPTKWKEVGVILKGAYVDSTLLKKDGWYYLSTLRVDPDEESELWVASSLRGRWGKHPQSKNHNQSQRLRRNGGSFLQEGGGVSRIAQDCNGEYGRRLFKVPITEITDELYLEGRASLLECPIKGWVHTYNCLESGVNKIEVVDRCYHRHCHSMIVEWFLYVRLAIKMLPKLVKGMP